MEPTMRVTLQTIADATGADRGTVSRVLSGRAREYKIGQARARRIEETAARLGYRPNELGRALRSGKNCDIGLLMATGDYNWLPDTLLAGVQDGLAPTGYTLRLARLDFTDRRRLSSWSQGVRRDMIDGLLVAARREAPGLSGLRRELAAWGRPTVWLTDHLGDDAVLTETPLAAERATDHLVALGHRRIDCLSLTWPGLQSPTDPTRTDLRFAGYQAAMQRHGLPAYKHHAAPGSVALAASLRARLAAPDRPTALLCHGDQWAISALLACAEAGLRVPADVSILSLGSVHGQATEHLSRFTHDEYERGRLSASYLHDKLRDSTASLPAPRLAATLTEGRTTSPPST